LAYFIIIIIIIIIMVHGLKVHRCPQGATNIIQAITGEGLAQGPYVAARGGVETTTFRTEGTDNIYLTNHAHITLS